jgi:hypothetical protein
VSPANELWRTFSQRKCFQLRPALDASGSRGYGDKVRHQYVYAHAIHEVRGEAYVVPSGVHTPAPEVVAGEDAVDVHARDEPIRTAALLFAFKEDQGLFGFTAQLDLGGERECAVLLLPDREAGEIDDVDQGWMDELPGEIAEEQSFAPSGHQAETHLYGACEEDLSAYVDGRRYQRLLV